MSCSTKQRAFIEKFVNQLEGFTNKKNLTVGKVNANLLGVFYKALGKEDIPSGYVVDELNEALNRNKNANVSFSLSPTTVYIIEQLQGMFEKEKPVAKTTVKVIEADTPEQKIESGEVVEEEEFSDFDESVLTKSVFESNVVFGSPILIKYILKTLKPELFTSIFIDFVNEEYVKPSQINAKIEELKKRIKKNIREPLKQYGKDEINTIVNRHDSITASNLSELTNNNALNAVGQSYINYLIDKHFDSIVEFYFSDFLTKDDNVYRRVNKNNIASGYNYDDATLSFIQENNNVYQDMVEMTPVITDPFDSTTKTGNTLTKNAVARALTKIPIHPLFRTDIKPIQLGKILLELHKDNSISNKERDIYASLYNRFFHRKGSLWSMMYKNRGNGINYAMSENTEKLMNGMMIYMTTAMSSNKMSVVDNELTFQKRVSASAVKNTLVANMFTGIEEAVELEDFSEITNKGFYYDGFAYTKSNLTEDARIEIFRTLASKFNEAFNTRIAIDGFFNQTNKTLESYARNTTAQSIINMVRLLNEANKIKNTLFAYSHLGSVNERIDKILADRDFRSSIAALLSTESINDLNKKLSALKRKTEKTHSDADLIINTKLANAIHLLEAINPIAQLIDLQYNIKEKVVSTNVMGDQEADITVNNVILKGANYFSEKAEILEKQNKEQSVLRHNLFINSPSIISRIDKKDGVKVGDVSKPHSKLNAIETFIYNFEKLFLSRYDENKDTFYDVMAASDKSTNYAVGISNFRLSNNKKFIERFTPKYTINKHIKSLKDQIFEEQKAYHEQLGRTLFNDYSTALKNEGFAGSSLEELNTFLKEKSYSYDTMAEMFYSAKLPFIEDWHFNGSSKFSNLTIELNPTMLEGIRINTDTKSFNSYMNSQFAIMKEDLATSGYTEILDPDTLTENVADQDFNALLELYFYSWNAVSEPFMQGMQGSMYQYGSRNPFDFNASMSERWVTQVKRNNIPGASFTPYRIGSNYGVEESTNVAAVNDPKHIVNNILGDSKAVERFDGASWTWEEQAMKEDASLGVDTGYNPGFHHKSIFHDFDVIRGVMQQTKHASHRKAAEDLRNSIGSEYGAYALKKKAFTAIPFDKGFTINGLVRSTDEKPILKYNPQTGKVEKIEIDHHKEFYNMWDLYQHLGGPWTVVEDKRGGMRIDGKSYRFTTAEDDKHSSKLVHQLEALDSILNPDNNIKGKYIGRISFLSTIKTGASTLNSIERLKSDKALMHSPISNRNGGIQLNATKDVENAKVSVSTQILNAATFGAENPERVKNIYNAIADISAKRTEKILGDDIVLDKPALSSFARRLVKEMIEKGRFVSGASEAAKYLNVPYDSSLVYGTLIKAINSYITANGIKAKMSGNEFIVSSNSSEIFDVMFNEEVTAMTYPEVINHIHNKKNIETVSQKPISISSEGLLFSDGSPLIPRPLKQQQITYEENINGNWVKMDIRDSLEARILKEIKDAYSLLKKGRTVPDSSELLAARAMGVEIEHWDKLGTNQEGLFLEEEDLNKKIVKNYLQKKLRDIKDPNNADRYRNVKEHAAEIAIGINKAVEFGITKSTYLSEVNEDYFKNRFKFDKEQRKRLKAEITEELKSQGVDVFEGVKASLRLRGQISSDLSTDILIDKIINKQSIGVDMGKVSTISLEEYREHLMTVQESLRERLKVLNGVKKGKQKYQDVRGKQKKYSTVDAEIKDAKKKLSYISSSLINNEFVQKDIDDFNRAITEFADSYRKTEEITKNAISRRAKKMKASWDMYIEGVAGRIPAQAHQSAMAVKVAYIIHDQENTIYLPSESKWYKGEDEDIDKEPMLMFTPKHGEVKWSENMDITDKSTWENAPGLEEPIEHHTNWFVYNLLEVMKDSRNMIARESPMEMNAPKKAAINSPKENMLKRFSNRNPYARDKIKEANMVGKDVIGIVATGLKVFSALVTAYHQDPEMSNVRMENSRMLIKMEDSIFKFNGKEYPFIANLNTETIDPRVLGEMASYLKIYTENDNYKTMSVEEIIEDLRAKIPMQESSVDMLSELLSAATDNAKELLLDKINASPDTAGMYCFLLTAGVPFQEIATFFKSPEVQAILTFTEKNIFENPYKMSFKGFLEAVTAPVFPVTETVKSTDQDAVINQFIEHAVKNGASRNFIENAIVNFANVYEASKGFRILGQALSLNQGVPQGDYETMLFRKTIESFINNQIGNVEFNLLRFASDYDYAESMIDRYEEKRKGYNLLWVIKNVPHFNQYLQLFVKGAESQNILSIKNKKANDILDLLEKTGIITDFNSGAYSPAAHKSVMRFIDDKFVASYLKTLQKTEMIDGVLTTYVVKAGENNFNLATDKEAFLSWVVETYLPSLKKSSNSIVKNNDFLKLLQPTYTKKDLAGRYHKVIRPVLDFNALNDEEIGLMKDMYKEKFTELDGVKDEYGNDIYQVLRLYNLIEYHDSTNSNSLSNFYTAEVSSVRDYWNYLNDMTYEKFQELLPELPLMLKELAVVYQLAPNYINAHKSISPAEKVLKKVPDYVRKYNKENKAYTFYEYDPTSMVFSPFFISNRFPDEGAMQQEFQETLNSFSGFEVVEETERGIEPKREPEEIVNQKQLRNIVMSGGRISGTATSITMADIIANDRKFTDLLKELC